MTHRMTRRMIGAALAAAVGMAAVPATAQQKAQVRLNLTPAGQAVAKRFMGAPDPQLVAMNQRAVAVVQRQKALIAAPRLDLVQFAAVLRQREQLQSQIMRHSNDRMLKMLGELSEADRVAMMRGMSNPIITPAPARK